MQRHSLVHRREAPDQGLSGWATVGVGLGYVDEVPFAEQALGLVVGGLRSRHVSGDPHVFARDDLLAAEVTAISDDLQLFGLHGGAGALRHHRQLVAIVADIDDVVVDDQVCCASTAVCTL